MAAAVFVLLPILAFLAGSIPFGLVVARMRGVDIRKVGSGNIGATNVLRSQGKAMGAAVLLLDVAKGLVPAAVGLGIHPADASLGALAGLAAILGHCFSIFLKGKGGKGVATALGAFLALAPAATGLVAALFVLLVATTRYVSLGSLVAALAMPVATALLRYDGAVTGAAAVAAGVIAARHRDNVKRLLKGTESKLGSRALQATPEATPQATLTPGTPGLETRGPS